MNENEIARIVVDAALKIHKTLGPGLLESVYQATLEYELGTRGLKVIQQVALPVYYERVKLNLGFRVDLLVADKVIIEIKSVEALAPVHRKQLETYLRLMDLRLGLLINFNVELIRDGIQRVVNRLAE
jgi:GxxExxY protein